MKRPTRDLLEEIQATFPGIQWDAKVLEDLVEPRFGIITGFPELLEDIHALYERDLGDCAPAGPLTAPIEE